ncbi:glycosyl hydrolase [Kamptonema cortianum]|nr:glycosyl hydrolase [Kamptonema cortianum]
MLRRIAVIALSLAVAVCHAEQISSRGFGLYVDRVPTVDEAARNFTGAKFEPQVGCYAGAYIDLDSTITETFTDRTNRVRRLPSQFESKVGKPHATYFYYMGYRSRLAYDWIEKLGHEGKIVHIALEPNLGLEWVKDDDYLEEMATMFAKSGAPIFLRFASEMNGPWVKYHGNPKLYIEKFRLIATKMREKAPNVAMVWCPYATPVSPIRDYYPGDEYVDWVGVNLYSVTYFNQNINQPAKHVHPISMLEYVYDLYSAKKPIMVGEYGATHFSALEGKPTVDFATRALMGMYEALPRAYPRVKCINYFSGNNLVLDHRKNNNYALTQHPRMLDTYRNIISAPYFCLSQLMKQVS